MSQDFWQKLEGFEFKAKMGCMGRPCLQNKTCVLVGENKVNGLKVHPASLNIYSK